MLLVILFLFLAALAVAYGIFHRYYSMLDIEDPENTVAVTFIGEEDEADVEGTSLSDEEVEELESRERYLCDNQRLHFEPDQRLLRVWRGVASHQYDQAEPEYYGG